ncbi:unnamed protein product [Dictyota dichotoma]|uniref:Ribosomal protein S3 n=1 Tax=Dictyota dichotoma TaxID=2876 RepID=Q2TUB8_DICDH|nr:ribosomal protein S3 [Dictyota dichotoma]AAS79077.1 ribosomal protein S3 [Dictyota dichotoma]
MGQKANPNSIRRINEQYRGIPFWNTPVFNYNTYSIQKLINACCRNTSIYLNKIIINISHGSVYVECYMIQLFQESNKKRKSRRRTENDKNSKNLIKNGWTSVIKRLYFALKLIQKQTGLKKIKIKTIRKKLYTKNIPKSVRQKTCFYTRGFNSVKFNYARPGMQILTAIMKGETTADCFNNFIRQNIRTRSKRKKHTDFTRFLKQGIEIFDSKKKIKGIKIQLKGRFGYKPKGRSKIWKYQLGSLPLSQIRAVIQYRSQQAQTKLGSVGIKTWIYYN